jgi:uncharacterized protein (TIGR03435 family)
MTAFRNAIRALSLLSAACLAQAQIGARFDAASVKVDHGAFVFGVSRMSKGGPGTSDPGRVTLTQMTLRQLIVKAWGLRGDDLTVPAWISEPTDFFTVTATMPADTSKERFQEMLQNLLIERFQLKLHHETRNSPGYELVVAGGGPKLHETTQDPGAEASDDISFRGFDADRFPILPPGPGVRSVIGKGEERARFQAQSMADFALTLGDYLRGSANPDTKTPFPRVADKTGLTGRYDFTLGFDCPWCQGLAGLPMSALGNIPTPPPGEGGTGVAQDPGSGFTNLFTALEKQLGLKVVKTQDVPVDVLVIDSAEKVPVGN